jgi:hypothetical protein
MVLFIKYLLKVSVERILRLFFNPRATNNRVDRFDNATIYGGLSEFGKLVIIEMNRIGMMVDLSHTSHQTQLDVLNVTKAPVIFSHSSSYTLCNHSRNVRDDVLLKLVKDQLNSFKYVTNMLQIEELI